MTRIPNFGFIARAAMEAGKQATASYFVGATAPQKNEAKGI